MNIVKELVGRRISGLFAVTKTCSTRMVNDHMFECTARKPNPRYCEHSLSMGGGYICKHPDRRNFVD